MSTAAQQPNTREVDLVLGQLEAIPPLSPVATRILSLTSDENASPKDLVRLIETDPALTARLLSMLGRAEAGVRPAAVNLDNAVRLLGFKAIRHVTLALKVQEAFGLGESDHEKGSPFDRLAFWKHCLAVACAAQGLAEATNQKIDIHEAFVCGLLHDLGKIALHTAMPKSYAKIVVQADELRSDIGAIERRVLGADHSVAGHRLAKRWSLPQRLVECIWLHHQTPEALPANIAAQGHVQLIHLADTIAREQQLGWSGNYRVSTASHELAKRIGISQEAVQRVVESLAEAIDARAEWIGGERIDARREYLQALLKTTEDLTRHHEALRREVVRHRRKEAYFNAVCRIVSDISPDQPLRDVCDRLAAELGRALEARACMAFAIGTDDWIELAGWADGRTWGRSESDASLTDGLRGECDAIVSPGDADAPGGLLRPVSNAFASLIARCGDGAFSDDGIVWIPLKSRGDCRCGIILSVSDNRAAVIDQDATAVSAVCDAAAAALTNSYERAASVRLSDELADAGRRAGEAQREAANQRLIDTVTAMAAGAAHELNNPLTVISGRAQALGMRIADPDAKKSLDAISAHAKAASDIVSELMAFAKSPVPSPSNIDLAGCINDVASDLAADGLLADAPSVELPSELPQVRFDRDRLRDVFREILENSLEATSADSRRLAIKAAYDPAEEQVVVSVIDNGRGMTAEVLSRAMDPFYSHRPAGRSRGLGLARVRRWMLLGGGDVQLESKPDVGTRVVLRLPAANDAE
ncbi:MAG: HDOD domain-containing protein [Phycisphaerales bacterium]|nr:HDOD domain-containing protein [Phycisphaerales bacterium]MCB9862235.1 HDOD domain-containing protein [Phycisphaerales bacterium]